MHFLLLFYHHIKTCFGILLAHNTFVKRYLSTLNEESEFDAFRSFLVVISVPLECSTGAIYSQNNICIIFI